MKKIQFFAVACAVMGAFSMSAQAQTVTVKGRILFEGTPPPSEKVEVKSDIAACGSEKTMQVLVLGEGQGIANAVVKIIGAAGTAVPKTGKINQANCEFAPHVQAITVGSTLNITSEDSVLHNSHGFYEDGSTAFNIAVPFSGIEIPVTLDKAGMIKLRCDAGHTWMNAYVFVEDQPFYAVTDANGHFSIDGVPPGNYEIQVWQEWLGVHQEKLEVKEGASDLTLTLKKE